MCTFVAFHLLLFFFNLGSVLLLVLIDFEAEVLHVKMDKQQLFEKM